MFDCVVVSEAVGFRKPDKAIFKLACEKVNAAINTSVFIGDNPVADIKGAKDAGMMTVYVPATDEYEDCAYADETYAELGELVGYVQKV